MFTNVPLDADGVGEAIVEEEDPDAGQLGDFTGSHSLHTTSLQQLNHCGSIPEPLLPLGKDQRACGGAEEEEEEGGLREIYFTMSGVRRIHTIIIIMIRSINQTNAAYLCCQFCHVYSILNHFYSVIICIFINLRHLSMTTWVVLFSLLLSLFY